ncbi:hypothetical protein BGW80DRAFT_1250644 [Lactifluus volemus]|nr:hypothetical protein BGW80DRAFT_1250644 [Lactifluus volemus]
MTRALRHDPWAHPTMGTDLREPIPADPRLMPQFTPLENSTPAERAAESAALIAEAGKSAQHLGVPLTLQDFPRDPAIHGGTEKENPMFPRFHSLASTLHVGVKRRASIDADVDAAMAAMGFSPTLLSFSKASSRRRAGVENGPEAAGPSNSTFTTELGSTSAPPVFASSIEHPTTTKKSKKKGKASSNNKSRSHSDMQIDETLPPPIPVIVEPSTATTTVQPPPTGTSRKRSRRVAEIEEDTPIDDRDPTVAVASGPTPAPLPVPKRGSKTQRAPKKTTKKVKREQEEPQEETRQPAELVQSAAPPNKRRKRSAAPSPGPPTIIGLDDNVAAVGVVGVVDESGLDQEGSLRRSKRVTRSSATAGQTAAAAAAESTVVMAAATNTTAKGAARKRNGSGKRATTRS